MSMVASGKFASSIVFDKRGRARVYVIPANPQSEGQGDVRQKLAACQAVLKLISAAAILLVKAFATTPYLWNSWSVQQSIGSGGAVWTAGAVVWTAFTAPNKAAWDASFPTVIVPDIAYKLMADVTSGEAAFHVAYGLKAGGAFPLVAAPIGTNSADWATALL